MMKTILIILFSLLFISCSSVEQSQYAFERTFDYNKQYKCEDGNVMLSWLTGTGIKQNNRFQLYDGIKAQIVYVGMKDSSTIILRYNEDSFGFAGSEPDSEYFRKEYTIGRHLLGNPDWTYDVEVDIKKIYMVNIQGFPIHIDAVNHHFIVFEVMKR